MFLHIYSKVIDIAKNFQTLQFQHLFLMKDEMSPSEQTLFWFSPPKEEEQISLFTWSLYQSCESSFKFLPVRLPKPSSVSISV